MTGLNVGAKAGIGVGVTFGVCLVGAALNFVLRRRWKGRGHEEQHERWTPPIQVPEDRKPELTGCSSRMEMDAVHITHEMPTNHEIHEMSSARNDTGLGG
jgi:hypothetical protein